MAYDTQLFSNNAVTLLANPISPIATSFTVMPGYGALFPNPGAGEYFLVTLEDEASTIREIVRVNARSGDTFLNVERGQEGTVARMWTASTGADTLVDHRVTADTMRRAMLLPEQTVKSLDDLSDVSITSVPVVGAKLTWDGSTWVPQSGGTAWINGENNVGTLIPASVRFQIDTTQYSSANRTFKYIVSVTRQTTYESRAFEVLLVITGDLNANTEVANANQYATVGPKFSGRLHAVLDPNTKSAWVRQQGLFQSERLQ